MADTSLITSPAPRPVNLTTGTPSAGPVPGGNIGSGPGDGGYALIYFNQSRIGTLVPDVVIEEVYDDQLQVTEHPVEDGAAVSDHAFLRAKTVDMKIGFADYKQKQIGSSIREYEFLLAIQARRDPMDITTGKRIYRNMLPIGITVTNDQRTKWAVIATVRLREVRISTARSVNTATNTAQRQSTAPATNIGQQILQKLTEVNGLLAQGVPSNPSDAASSVLQGLGALFGRITG